MTRGTKLEKEGYDTVEKQLRKRKVIFNVTAVPKRHNSDMTICQSEKPASQKQRGRWTCFAKIYTTKDDDWISEYKELRNKNIQENLSMLRFLMLSQEFEIEPKFRKEKTERRKYNKVPLPPPRPKSERLQNKILFCKSKLPSPSS